MAEEESIPMEWTPTEMLEAKEKKESTAFLPVCKEEKARYSPPSDIFGSTQFGGCCHPYELVEELSLVGLDLGSVPSQVWESSDIIKFDLSRNSIEELPVELSSYTSLKTLILSKNKLKDSPGSVLKWLPNLSCLKLDNNPLRQVIEDTRIARASLLKHPAFASIPQLQELYLR